MDDPFDLASHESTRPAHDATQGPPLPPLRRPTPSTLQHSNNSNSNSDHVVDAQSSLPEQQQQQQQRVNNNNAINNSNNGTTANRRHSYHTAGHAKSRPMIRSTSGQLNHTHHHHHGNHSTGEHRGKPGMHNKQRRRRAKFVCGDQSFEEEEEEGAESDEKNKNKHRDSEEGSGGKDEEGRRRSLRHDGHHPYHHETARHLHAPYPHQELHHPSHSHHQPHHPPQHQHEQAQEPDIAPTRVQKQVPLENRDDDQGPISESIPNSSQRGYPQRTQGNDSIAEDSQTTTISTIAPAAEASTGARGKDSERSRLAQPMQELLLGRSADVPQDQTQTYDNHGKARHEPAAVVGAAAVDPPQQSHHWIHHEEGHAQGHPSGSTLKAVAPLVLVHNLPTLAVHASTPPTGANMASGSKGPLVSSALTSTANTISPPSQQKRPSERLTRLLKPSPSAASLPSITRTFSQPVLTVISPSFNNNDSNHLGRDGDHPASITSANASASSGLLSAQQQDEQQQQLQTAISPVGELVSKFLSPFAHTRSQSQSSLNTTSWYASGGGSGVGQQQQQRHHVRNGSGTSAMSGVSVRSDQPPWKRLPHQQPPQRSTSANGASIVSPPRLNNNNVDAGVGAYLISRFLPTSPNQMQLSFSSSSKAPPAMSTLLSTSASSSTFVQNNTAATGTGASSQTQSHSPSQSQRRRLPASLRMTSTGFTPERDSVAPAVIQDQPTTPSTPSSITSNSSTYSSSEGAVSKHPQQQQQSSYFATSPWKPAESMSRTQQKLLLQRASSQDDVDEEEMTRRGKMMREMERVQREYRAVRMFADPVMESLARCFQDRREQEQRETEAISGAQRDGLSFPHSASSITVNSM